LRRETGWQSLIFEQNDGLEASNQDWQGASFREHVDCLATSTGEEEELLAAFKGKKEERKATSGG